MKPLAETQALRQLAGIREEFRAQIRSDYEQQAKPCATCETPGACCLDAHFVNVRITKLEAVAVRKELEQLSEELRTKVDSRIAELQDHPIAEKYSCPLFEKGIGCLVHETAKPLPCIAHACYERKEDLPPDELLAKREIKIEKLNRRVYGKTTFLPIPVAVRVTPLHVQTGTAEAVTLTPPAALE
jgi:hypothetical protein